jgi:hypothetical protein
MRFTTTDPLSLSDVTDFANARVLIDGGRPRAIKINFESEASPDAHLAFQ